MTAETLLSRLEGVRPTGRDKWIARCPAHEDRRPSLSVRLADSGAVLLYCFAGCSAAEITAAIGVDLSDLFPPRQSNVHFARARASALTPLVATFERDLIIVRLFLADLAAETPIPNADRETAGAASARVWRALQEARHVI